VLDGIDVLVRDKFAPLKGLRLGLITNHTGTDRERNGLAVRRIFRVLAPWAMENPILMHVTSSKPAAVKAAIDQCADVGFEMVIMSFGSGFNIENQSPQYISQIKSLVQYANSKGIRLGGYSLLASRGDSGPDNEVINPETHKPGGAIYGQSPCLESVWGQNYFKKLRAFTEETGLNAIEHDGSYPGDLCARPIIPATADWMIHSGRNGGRSPVFTNGVVRGMST